MTERINLYCEKITHIERGKWVMTKVMNAINTISAAETHISRNTIETILTGKEEAKEYFLNALDRMLEDDAMDDEVLLNDTYFGLYFLTEWKETKAFKKIQEVLHHIGEDVYTWLGDVLTEEFPSMLYHLYDSDAENLKSAILDSQMDPYSRIAYIDALFQLYVDGVVEKDVLLEVADEFEKSPEFLAHKYEFDINISCIATELCYCFAKTHVKEFLYKTKEWMRNELLDIDLAGGYKEYEIITNGNGESNVIQYTTFTAEEALGRCFKIVE